jgi:hypothetical protein
MYFTPEKTWAAAPVRLNQRKAPPLSLSKGNKEVDHV